MKFLIVLALCVAASSAYTIGSPVLADTNGIDGRITKGEKAAPGQFPYQVGLSMKRSTFSSFWCGGSLISTRWVLTAAHCTEGIPEIIVYLGATVRLSAQIKYNVRNDAVTLHPGWDRNNALNDISLILIPFTSFTSRINRVRLPAIAGPYSLYTGDRVIASGWGYTSDSSSINDDLMFTVLEIVSNSACEKEYSPASVKNSNICVSTPRGSSTCQGDSGGPLVLESSKIQVGLTSYGSEEGCELGKPVVFTRITSYLDWIKEKTGVEY